MAFSDELRRYRRLTVVAAAATVAAVLVGGVVLGQLMSGEAAPGRWTAASTPSSNGAIALDGSPATAPVPSAVTAPPPGQTSPLSWSSAMVAPDGTTITVYGGADFARCEDLSNPRARVTEQNDIRVVIAVSGRIVDAADCTTSGIAIPLAVKLRKPLGDRILRDATGQPRPTYFHRHLPDFRSDERWSPHPTSWMSTDESWHQGFNGPGGSALRLTAQPRTAPVTDRGIVATIQLGPYKGAITGGLGGMWTVWWDAGDATYSLQLVSREGGAFTVEQFKQELGRLTWS